jgi:hypothetical protein
MEVMIAHAAFLKDFKPTCDSTSPGRMLIGEPFKHIITSRLSKLCIRWDRAPNRESTDEAQMTRCYSSCRPHMLRLSHSISLEETHERSALPTRQTRRLWR